MALELASNLPIIGVTFQYPSIDTIVDPKTRVVIKVPVVEQNAVFVDDKRKESDNPYIRAFQEFLGNTFNQLQSENFYANGIFIEE